MDENKFVTYEMFQKYHELLMRYIKNGDGLLVVDDLVDIVSNENCDEENDETQQR